MDAGNATATRGRAAPPVRACRRATCRSPVSRAYVRRPANQMPPYTEKVVSNADLVNIHAFIQSRPAPPPVASLPLLEK